MARAHTTAGFSMIELMVVVAIIGVMSAAIMPSMSDILADHRQGSLTMDTVRLGRKARALTMASGLAHMLRYQQGQPGLGMIDLLRGATPRCVETPWAQAFGRPLETVNARVYNPTAIGVTPTAADDDRHVILLEASSAGTVRSEIWICYQPNGYTYTAIPGIFPLARQADTAPVSMTIRGSINHVSRGQNRDVLFLAGDTARVR